MKTAIAITAALLLTANANGQTPTLSAVSLKAEVGFTPLPIDQGKTTLSSPCASSSYTTDSKIYTIIVKLTPQITGATEFKRFPNVWVDDTNPQKYYFLTGNPGVTEIKTSRRSYDAAFVNAAAEIVVPDLTWADASDILADLNKTPRPVSGGSLSMIPVTLPANTDLNGLVQAMSDRGFRVHSKAGWTTGMQLLQATPPVMSGIVVDAAIPLEIPATTGRLVSDVTDAQSHLQGLVNAVGINKPIATSDDPAAANKTLDLSSIFLVDSPCLTVELLPSVAGSKVTGGVINFNGHYLFPFAHGKSFAKFDVGGTSPLDRSVDGASTTLTAAIDAALNHDMNASGMSGPVRFTGGLTASYERNETTGAARTSKGSGGLKGSVSFPGLTLTGNDTRPTLTFEAVGSTINGTDSDTSQFEGNAKFKAKFRWTPIFNSAIDAAYNLSHDAIFGNKKSNYMINVDVLKFTVRDPLEFAATWRCGRAAPDYKRVCGFYTGFSMTSQQ